MDDKKHYIDIDQLFKCETCFYCQNGKCEGHVWCECGEAYRPAMSKLKIVEIRHGHWYVEDGRPYMPFCSGCNYEPLDDMMTNYCANCGAKMDEEVEVRNDL